MKKKLNVLISGLGRIAWRYHIPQVMEHANFNLLAVADPVTERLDEAVANWPGIHTYSDFKTMCEAEKSADIAVIASPTIFHKEQALTAFEHNLDVFLEKPMCENFASARQLADAAEAAGRKVMLYQPHRNFSEYRTFNAEVRQKLGRIFHCRRTLTIFNRRNDWQSRTDCGGGMLNNYGAHYIDQFLAAFGGPLNLKGCSMKRAVGIGDAEDVVNIIMESASGVTCDLEINLGSPVYEDSWTVFGDLGMARWSSASRMWELQYVTPGTLKELTLQQGQTAQDRTYSVEGEIAWIKESVATEKYSPANYYDYIYEYMAENKPPFVPLSDTMEVMRFINACRLHAGKN